IGVGGFLPNVSSKGHLSSPSIPGSDVSLEDALGLKPNLQSIDLEATWRLGTKQLITLGYFGVKRSASKTLQDTLHWGDSTYDAGATIDASNQLQYYGLTYRYYIWRHTQWELGAGLGIDALNISASLGLRVAVSGGGGGFADSAKKSGGFTAPAPMLGLYGDWEFQPRFYLRGQAQYLYVNKVEGWGGYVTDDRLAVEWFPLHNYGLGLAYHYVGFRITKDFSNGGALQYTYALQGPALYLTAAF
ncbi:MAG TPA: hypothetical protein VMT93_06985, partial [Gemmatimonadaceae bacterium]|nr:hypothetical protein [Gemmatimonadaceae bacterium]